MGKITSAIDQAIPFIIIGGLTLFMTLEIWMPYLKPDAYRKTQRWHNIGNVVLILALNGLLSWVVAYCLEESTKRHFGLLWLLHLPMAIMIIAGILVSDLNAYVFHRMYHRVPLLWRFHTVHHSDVHVDTSTGLRIHPVEFFVQTASQAIVLPLMGVSINSFLIYVLFLVVLAIVNHSNIKFPAWYKRSGAVICNAQFSPCSPLQLPARNLKRLT